ncbi:hypothetical protein [Rubrivirga sp. IMCC43871]|uniref:hypothetical protein n=1 Tax=Rubrivirga sp. IMCC43871 TaxID=3391575 RepID=UPI00398FEF83
MRLLVLAAAVLLGSVPALAQRFGDAPPRIGVGFDVATAITNQSLIPDGPSIGLRARAALPVNADLSLAASLGVGAHLFEGAGEARYVANPQASIIVTLPGRGAARYLMGGFGGMVPLSGGGGGLTLHAGYGWAIPLTETSLFVEVNPSLVIGERETTPVLAVRTGVIF